MTPDQFAAVVLALKALGIAGGAAFVAIVVTNILKMNAIPINIPPRWTPIFAGLLSLVQSVAAFYLGNDPVIIGAAFSVAAFFLPAGVHAAVSKPKETPSDPAPTKVENTAELAAAVGTAVAAALPAPSPPMMIFSTPPPAPQQEPPAPTPEGAS